MGINILTSGDEQIRVEGVEEYIEKYSRGEISKEELYRLILDAPVVKVEDKK